MALDSGFLRAILKELNENIIDAKVDKVHQMDKDNILLSLRAYRKGYKIIMSASANNARVHFTDTQFENPKTPPMFCMLLRKHLMGSRLVEVIQPDFERVLSFCFEGYNELGEKNKKYLVVEIMGRHSNIILYDDERRIIDSIRHVDFTMSSQRQVLPGLYYENPPSQNKLNPLFVVKDDVEGIIASLNSEKPLNKELLAKFTGFSPIICRELAFRGSGSTEVKICDFTELQMEKFKFYLWDLIEKLQEEKFTPTIIREGDTKKPKEFSYIDIRQYGLDDRENFESPSLLVDSFYEKRDKFDRMRQKSNDIFKVVMNNIERVSKKISLQEVELLECKNRDEFKIWGDLIMSSLYKIEKGMTNVTLQNFYREDLADIVIELYTHKNPSQNAQMYYKKYQKAKTKESFLISQMEKNVVELEYLESIFNNIYKIENEKELEEMRSELKAQGYIVSRGKENPNKKVAPSKPMHFVSSDGYDIFVGKNNMQNDKLTLKDSGRHDLWLHTKNIAGSHTVIVSKGEGEFPDRTITEGAILAATFSKARDSANVPVDYTLIKNIKKPSGSKPGMVIYEEFRTAYVTPNQELADALRVNKEKN